MRLVSPQPMGPPVLLPAAAHQNSGYVVSLAVVNTNVCDLGERDPSSCCVCVCVCVALCAALCNNIHSLSRFFVSRRKRCKDFSANTAQEKGDRRKRTSD